MSENLNLFDMFGGISKMASELKEAVSTVSSWKIVGRVPATKQPAVLDAAERLGLPITAEHLVFPMGRPAREDAPPPFQNMPPRTDGPAPGPAPTQLGSKVVAPKISCGASADCFGERSESSTSSTREEAA